MGQEVFVNERVWSVYDGAGFTFTPRVFSTLLSTEFLVFFLFVCFGFVLADLKKASSANTAKSSLPKSGLRPPGYSRLPAAKLAAFGFVRSSSVSSVPSAAVADSTQPEPSRLANRKRGGGRGEVDRREGPPRCGGTVLRGPCVTGEECGFTPLTCRYRGF